MSIDAARLKIQGHRPSWPIGAFLCAVALVLGVAAPAQTNSPPVVSGDDSIKYAEHARVAVHTYTAQDPDGDPFTWSLSGADIGALQIDASLGTLTFRSPPAYDPATDNTYEVTVEASDGSLTGTLDVSITISRPPAWSGDTVQDGKSKITVAEDTPDLTNIAELVVTDPDGNDLSWQHVTTEDYAKFRWIHVDLNTTGITYLQISRDTVLDYENPGDVDANNVYRTTLRVRDRVVGATWVELPVEVTVTNVYETPEAVRDTVDIDEDSAVTIDVLDNDFVDADATPASVTGVGVQTAPTNGSAVLDTDTNTVTYTPDADFFGTDTFSYTISDAAATPGTHTGTIEVRVAAVNDAPVANADSADTTENIPVGIGVLDNDSDVDSTSLSVSAVGTPSRGRAAISPDSQTVTYTPDADFRGTDSFSYTVSDGQDPPLTATGTVNVTIREGKDDADLSGLTISSGTLTPGFGSTVLEYTVDVAFDLQNMTVTPTTADADATVTVNGTPVTSGNASGNIPLTAGNATAIEVEVTAQNRRTRKTYEISVFRPPPAHEVYLRERFGDGFVWSTRDVDNTNFCLELTGEGLCVLGKEYTRFTVDAESDIVQLVNREKDSGGNTVSGYWRVELVDEGTITLATTPETTAGTEGSSLLGGSTSEITLELDKVNNLWTTIGATDVLTAITTCWREATPSSLTLTPSSGDRELASAQITLPATRSGSDAVNHRITVGRAVDSVKLTPRWRWDDDTLSCGATVSVGAEEVGHDQASDSIALRRVGATTIPVVFTNGSFSRTHNVTIGRPAPRVDTAPGEDDDFASSDQTATTFEDTAYAFSAADFGLSDVGAGGMPDHVKIVSLPAEDRGTLELAGTALAGDSLPRRVTRDQLDDGAFVYTPPPGVHGAAFATFEFKVGDGETDSRSAYTMTIDVIPRLSVSFGAATYEAVEGGAPVTVTVELSRPAIVALEIPIRLTAGSAEEGDYHVVSALSDLDHWDPSAGTGILAFAAGDAAGSIVIRAEHDEDIHDETLMLGLGTLPAGALAGAPAAAVLTIGDDDGVGVPARFRRLNDEILSRHALAIDDLTHRAIGERMEERCRERAPALTLAGGSTLGRALLSNARAIEDGGLALDDVLADSSFALPLGAADDGAAGDPAGLALWGRGDRLALRSRDSAFAWDGMVLTGQLGIDGCLREDLVTGLALSGSVGRFDYVDATGRAPVSGGYRSRMHSVHPWLGWWSERGLGLWTTVGYGRGGIEIDDGQAGRQMSDTTLTSAAVGAGGPVLSAGSPVAGGTTTVMLKGEASIAQVDVAGNEDRIGRQTVHARRLRVALEGSHERALGSGGSLTPSLELALRHDGGDGSSAGGVELGGALRYRDPATGRAIEVRGRGLIGRDGYREWGLGGALDLGPGGDGRGLSLRLSSTLGDAASGVARVWERDAAAPVSNGWADRDGRAPGRLEAELGYGLSAPWAHALLTPYGGLSLVGDDARSHRLGARLEIGSAFTLGLEGEHRDSANHPPARRVMLHAQARW